MLVLNRRVDETIVIEHPDGDITVKVLKLAGWANRSNSIQLGVSAPQSVTIRRGELPTFEHPR